MRTLVLFALLCTFLSCVKDGNKDEEFYEIPIPDIDAVMLLYPNDSDLKLVLRSREARGPGSLVTDCNRVDASFNFYIHKALMAKDNFVDTIGDVQFIYDFPFLQPGEYPINIKIHNKSENKGKLLVGERRFEIQMDSLSEIGFPLGTVVEF